ncbi:MAG: PEP-CTERM sorting domain-containing protein [Planctomycetia bacterium]|nr:PEP-CTERM sorting domain-containing protein [Planctomycetia bacterium]
MFASFAKVWPLACLAVVLSLTGAPLARAQDTIGYSIRIGEGIDLFNLSPWLTQTQLAVAADRPLIELTNLSTSVDITDFTLSLGNTTFSFGSLIFLPQSTPARVIDFSPGDTPGLHAGLETASLSLANFLPGTQFGFRVDVDRNADHGLSLTNFRDALVSGTDSSRWATFDVTFSNGTVMHQTLTPQDLRETTVALTGAAAFCRGRGSPGQQLVTQNTQPTPEPSTLVLAAIALAATATVAARRQLARRRVQA